MTDTFLIDHHITEALTAISHADDVSVNLWHAQCANQQPTPIDRVTARKIINGLDLLAQRMLRVKARVSAFVPDSVK